MKRMLSQDPKAGMYFGCSLDAKGNMLVVGERGANPTPPVDAGRAHVYIGMKYFKTLVAPYPKISDRFGVKVKIGDDGRVMVGAYRHDHFTGKRHSGSVFVYDNEKCIPIIPDPALEKMYYGYAFDWSGARAVVGAYESNEVFFYNLNDANTLRVKRSGRFGRSIAMGQGVVAVGATDAGEVHLFDVNGIPKDTLYGPYGFGSSLAWHGDLLAIGSYEESQAHIYNMKTGKMVDIPGEDGSWFGGCVDINDKYLLVGAARDNKREQGAAFLYDHEGNEVQAIRHNSTENDGAWFGYSVKLDRDRFYIGAPREDTATGSVYVSNY